MRIVSYYTALYSEVAKKLIKSLNKFPEIHYSVEERAESGNWEKNTHYKAVFIREKLIHEPYVVWTDADSTVNQYPTLFDTIDCDVAFHWFKGEELISGTMYFKNTPKTLELLDSWIRLNKQFPENWDQVNLQNALNGMKDINVYSLPPEYNFITDLSREYYGNDIRPVFEHFQASRVYKRRLR